MSWFRRESVSAWFDRVSTQGFKTQVDEIKNDEDGFKRTVAVFLNSIATYHAMNGYEKKEIAYNDLLRLFTRVDQKSRSPDPAKRREYAKIRTKCYEMLVDVKLDLDETYKTLSLRAWASDYAKVAGPQYYPEVWKPMTPIREATFEADEKRRATMRAR